MISIIVVTDVVGSSTSYGTQGRRGAVPGGLATRSSSSWRLGSGALRSSPVGCKAIHSRVPQSSRPNSKSRKTGRLGHARFHRRRSRWAVSTSSWAWLLAEGMLAEGMLAEGQGGQGLHPESFSAVTAYIRIPGVLFNLLFLPHAIMVQGALREVQRFQSKKKSC